MSAVTRPAPAARPVMPVEVGRARENLPEGGAQHWAGQEGGAFNHAPSPGQTVWKVSSWFPTSTPVWNTENGGEDTITFQLCSASLSAPTGGQCPSAQD